MAESRPRLRRVSRWVFGESGPIVLESEMQLVTLTTAIGVSGVFVVSPILSELTVEFGVTESQVGLLMTLFTAPSIVLVPVAGILADRVGRRPVLTGGLLVYGLAGMGVGLVDSFGAALALRTLQGVGYAAVIPMTVTLLGDFYEGRAEVTAQGIRLASIQASSLALPPLAGLLVLWTWQAPFLLFAVALAAAGWVWVSLSPTGPEGGADARTYLRDLGSLLRRPLMALVVASFVLRFVLVFGFYTYVSILLSTLGSSSSVVSGLAVSLFSVFSLVGSSQTGRVAGSRGPLLVLFGGLVLSGVGMTLVGLSPSVAVFVPALAVFALGTSITGPVQKSLVNTLAPDELRAGAVSGATIAQSVGQTAGPVLMGVLVVAFSPAQVFVLTGVGGAVLGALVGGGALLVDGRRRD